MIQQPSQDIAIAANAVLAKSSVAELRQLRVDESGSELKLSGLVRSFYHKQLAQETVRVVAGALRVNNTVRVSG
ncbi:Transport-associated domain protein [Rhodopirellula maiorica SM1]|uniref:Transport-associated domain protein n=1 Tax=Rhodopirellula maiorica SM1 TaxID=1265738 RepID=M5RSV4_9BACT|nr:BON domain-containing protein [Rhodopirellula maiorica]EMI18472.1 Transport-associated domain protein [Rhodopirellula maiorica SM1]